MRHQGRRYVERERYGGTASDRQQHARTLLSGHMATSVDLRAHKASSIYFPLLLPFTTKRLSFDALQSGGILQPPTTSPKSTKLTWWCQAVRMCACALTFRGAPRPLR